MSAFLLMLGLMVAGGLCALLLHRNVRLSALAGAGSAMLGSAGALAVTLRTLFSGGRAELHAGWSMPMGSLAVEIDALSGFFLCAILGLSVLCALYGWQYMGGSGTARARGVAWFWFNLLIASMAVVVVARNGVLFLLAWEVMSLSSFFLVAFENGREEVRRAAWTYLVATHLGSAFLLMLFVVMGSHAGSLDFARFGALQEEGPRFLGFLFLLGLIGFGVKAGFYPLHVWLPEAHPAAPSHVSALMSGVMIKTGIYALLRLVSILGRPAPWWGWLVLSLGVVSGVLGVVFALTQRDIKRLLAYSSVENVGVVAMGLGLGLLGWSYGRPFVMAAGFAGCLLHVLNHAVFKGLLFLTAGSVVHATGCRELDRMGGLLRRMPGTGAAFLTGSVAISGLPPLNGFVSEFLIYAAAFGAMLSGLPGLAGPAIAVIGALALIGGLAAACFTKAFGIVFLGEPRSAAVSAAHECGWAMRLPLAALAACCFAIPWLAPWLVPALYRMVSGITGLPAAAWRANMLWLDHALCWVSLASCTLPAAILLLALVRRALLRGRNVGCTVTWDCGYAAPTPRMQYTASSYAQPIGGMFEQVLSTRTNATLPKGPFPAGAAFETRTADPADELLFRPGFRAVDRVFSHLRWMQGGRVQVYVVYIAVTLVLLLLFAL